MDLDTGYEYYNGGDTVSDFFNAKAIENGYYWIKALDTESINTIKIQDTQAPIVEESYYDITPPYFVVPHFLFNLFTGFSLRTIDGNDDFTWNDYGLKLYSTQKTIQNYTQFEFGKPIVLCEGPMDAEVLAKGYDCVFGLLGNNLTTRITQILSLFTDQWIIVPDNDNGGLNLKKKVYNRCSQIDNDVNFKVMDIPDGYNDPGEYFEYGDELFLKQLKVKLQTTLSEVTG